MISLPVRERVLLSVVNEPGIGFVLAEQLGLAPAAVSSALVALESDGLVRSRIESTPGLGPKTHRVHYVTRDGADHLRSFALRVRRDADTILTMIEFCRPHVEDPDELLTDDDGRPIRRRNDYRTRSSK